MPDALPDFISSFQNIPSRRELGRIVRDYYNREGIKMMTYHGYFWDGVPRPPAIDGYPAEWSKRYVAEHLERDDPMIVYASRNVMPVKWSDIGKIYSSFKNAQGVFERCT